MKVTTEGERVIDLLWDVIAAKGFEKDMYFEMAARDIRGAAEARGHGPREHGADPEVHGQLPVRPGRVRARARRRRDAADDEFLFRQGPARGPGQDPLPRLARRLRRASPHVPNVARFPEQADGAEASCSPRAPPAEEQQQDLDFLLTLGELFTLVVYGQLILEQAALDRARPSDVLDQIFDVLVRDFSALRGRAARQGLVDRRRSRRGRSPTCASRSSTRAGSTRSGSACARSPAPTRCAPSQLAGPLRPWPTGADRRTFEASVKQTRRMSWLTQDYSWAGARRCAIARRRA